MANETSDNSVTSVTAYSSASSVPCQQPPAVSSSSFTYGKEIEQLESLAIALCSQEIVEACQTLDISQGKCHCTLSVLSLNIVSGVTGHSDRRAIEVTG